jgi:hypothetical protein
MRFALVLLGIVAVLGSDQSALEPNGVCSGAGQEPPSLSGRGKPGGQDGVALAGGRLRWCAHRRRGCCFETRFGSAFHTGDTTARLRDTGAAAFYACGHGTRVSPAARAAAVLVVIVRVSVLVMARPFLKRASCWAFPPAVALLSLTLCR